MVEPRFLHLHDIFAADVAAIASLAKGTITVDALDSGGKRTDSASLGESGINPRKRPKKKPDDEDDKAETAKMYVPIEKASDEEQTVTGVVLQPEMTDAQGDIYDAAVIRAAAHRFLSNYNKQTKLGLQHKEFKAGRFALVESYLAPMDFALGSRVVKTGSWIMTVKVLDSKIWALVKAGKITGFSIGGRAKVVKLDD